MNKMSAFRTGLIVGSALSTVAVAPASAESLEEMASADAAAEAEVAADEILVNGTPIKDSLANSLEVQRKAPNIISAITADDAGQFPDQTVAAALARLPGIGVQRDQGQERYVQVRGAPTRWTVVSFDNINILGAEERIFRFDSVPAALISTVELNKTLMPDMPAEALAGRVNIKTYSALANPGFKGYLDLGYGFVDLGNGPQEQAAARLSWSNDMFGITVAGSHSQFEQQTDNSEPRYEATTGALRELRNAKYIIEREINSLSGKIEFRPSDRHKITATSLYTEFLDHEQRNQYTFTFAGADRSRTDGNVTDARVVGAFEQGEYKTSTFANIIHGDHDFGRLRLSWDGAYVETESSIALPIINQTASIAALRPDIRYTTGKYNLPVLSITNANGTTGSLDQQAFDGESLTAYMFGNKTKSYTGKIDFDYDWSEDASLAFGAQYDNRKLTDPGQTALLRPDGTSGSFAPRAVAAALGQPWTPGAFVTPTRVSEDLDRGYAFNYINNKAMRRQLDALIDAARTANAAGANFAVPENNPALANSVEERIIAGYVANSWTWDRLSLVAGVRVENTKVASSGAASVGAVLTPISLENEFTHVFPSLHLNFDATDELKLRAAFVSGAARPSFADQRATVTINDAAGLTFVSGGNPGLKPERAFGGDASVEWYFAPASLLSVSGFYRQVKDTLFETTVPVGDDRFNFGGVDRSGYDYTTTLNGGDGKLYGVEFAYNQSFDFLPAPFDGLGAQASLTLVDGEFETLTTPTAGSRKVAFPGTSKRITNLSAFYEKHGFSARVGYQHRTKWLDDISVDAASDIYWDANERVDLSFRYELVKNFTLYADVINVTNEAGIRFSGSRETPYEVELFGTRYLFGVKANF